MWHKQSLEEHFHFPRVSWVLWLLREGARRPLAGERRHGASLPGVPTEAVLHQLAACWVPDSGVNLTKTNRRLHKQTPRPPQLIDQLLKHQTYDFLCSSCSGRFLTVIASKQQWQKLEPLDPPTGADGLPEILQLRSRPWLKAARKQWMVFKPWMQKSKHFF